MNNSIYLRRKNKLYLEKGSNLLSKNYSATLLKNIENLGFTLSKEVLEIVETFALDELFLFYNQLVEDLKTMVGANVIHSPMYPNFPKQVMQMPEAELYFNALIHYLGDWIGRRIMPHYPKEQREPLNDNLKLKVIDLGSKEDFYSIGTNLLKAKTSISQTDKQDLEWFITHSQNLTLLLPHEIPLKENIALLGALLIKYVPDSDSLLQKYIKTATDVLRLCTAFSLGDISLARNTKFVNLTRKQRKIILNLLENCTNITEDMLRYANRWKRLGEILHPFEYQNKYPKCVEAFDTIRNDRPFQTFNSKVETALLNNDIEVLMDTLKLKAGEFARRLDVLLRKSSHKDLILASFASLTAQISSPVLLQVLTHFKHRNTPQAIRSFFPKGEVAKAYSIVNTLPPLNEKICAELVRICQKALIAKYQVLPDLGKVYIDPQLQNYNVPFALRSASKSLKTIVRGSKIDLPQGNTLRFFIWWKDGKDRTDLDLSAVALDENHTYLMDISYYNLSEIGGCHSGDITSAPEGASEFIDIEIESFKALQVRYVLMSVNSYTSQAFCDLPECFAGFMMRENLDSGEIYEPRTVQNKFDLTANTKIAIPLIIDLVDRKVIWTDLALRKNPSQSNNVLNNKSSIAILSQMMCSLIKPNLYDLFALHAQARGQFIEDMSKANTIFAVDKASDLEHIMAEFL